ncbi:MAG: autotransporter outer membrane beta-barrel domain-containing protein [Planctomycetes bacterium]|nr:autotransporter outer membrane beta-barrel domain-containing protein [Planctomycetota bacterium]
MKMRVLLGWLFAVALVCPTAFATEAYDIGTYTEEQIEVIENQVDIAEAFAKRADADETLVTDIFVGQTGGTALPAINAIIASLQVDPGAAASGYDRLTDDQKKTVIFLDRITGRDDSGPDAAATFKRGAFVNDSRAFVGAVGVASVNAGVLTAQAIGGTGGEIDSRINTIMAERRGMVERFGSDAGMASYNMNSNLANRIWVSPFYTWQDMGEKDNYEGFDYKAWGASLGYDHAFGPVTIGGAFTYSRGDLDVDNVNDDNTIDNYAVSLYANFYSRTGFFATLSGGFNYGDNDMERWIANGAGAGGATGGWQRDDNHTNTYWVGGKVGYDWKLSPNFTLTPSVGLYWSESKGSSYTSTGAMGNLHYDKITQKSLMLPIDLAARYRVDLGSDSSVTFKVAGGYAYNFKKDGASGWLNYDFANTPAVAVSGARPGHSSWNVGAGVMYQKGRWDVGVDYRYDGRSKLDAHRISATLGVNF